MHSVLIVDDDTELCELVSEYLRREGLEATAVHSGEEGVDRALSGDYSVVVLDVMLPSIGGFEVLRRIEGLRAMFRSCQS
jgi:DNA-binding response OmpR family regulator